MIVQLKRVLFNIARKLDPDLYTQDSQRNDTELDQSGAYKDQIHELCTFCHSPIQSKHISWLAPANISLAYTLSNTTCEVGAAYLVY